MLVIAAGLGLIAAAIVVALRPFDETLAVGLLAAGAFLAAWGLAAYLIPPSAPTRQPRTSQPPAPHPPPATDPYAKARELQAQAEGVAAAKAKAEHEAAERKRVRQKRSASRAIREELLDNAKAIDLIARGDRDAVLRLRHDRFDQGVSMLQEHDTPSPYVEVSAAYRETSHLWQSLTGFEENFGEPYVRGGVEASTEELEKANNAVEQAVNALDEFDNAMS